MSIDAPDTEYYAYLLAWIAVPIALFLFHSRGRRLAGVFVYAYFMGLFMNHWLGALVHASPWSEFNNSVDTISGFRLSSYGLLALAVGVLLVPSAVGRSRAVSAPRASGGAEGEARQFAVSFLAIGVVAWILSYTSFATLPSMAAVLSAGKQCLLLAVCLFCWIAWRRRRMSEFVLWASASLALPVLTVLTQGFIGYGIAMLATIVVFIAMFFRPRWILLVGLVVGMYAAVSLWVAYVEHRGDIRGAVWGGQSYSERIDRSLDMLQSIHPFDLSNPKDLAAVDVRLNQNWLVGIVQRTTPELVPFENGATLVSAVIAVIPRALWPDKPATGGSGNYVADHALLTFATGTSVGMGQVLEFYINFGVVGVVCGFLLFGAVIRFIDMRLTSALIREDYNAVQFYFLLGTGAMQAGGSMSEIVAAMAGGAVLSIATSQFLKRRAQASRARQRAHFQHSQARRR